MRIQSFGISLCLLLVFTALDTTVHAADNLPVIEIHAQVRLASMSANDETANRMGASESSELAIAVLEEAGLEYEYNLSPWTRIFQLLQSRPNVLALPVARIPTREHSMAWIGMTRPIQLSLYGLSKNEDRLPTTLEEARGFEIGVLRDDVIDQYLVSQGFDNLVRFSNLENSLDMLQRERFDLFPFDAIGIQRILKHNKLDSDLVVAMVPLEAISTESFLTLSLSTDETIKKRIRDAYNRVVEKGVFEAIMGFEHHSAFDH